MLTKSKRFNKICIKKKAKKKRSIYIPAFREKNKCCKFFSMEIEKVALELFCRSDVRV